jgi:L-2-hydroxycarboxylate dehydrogenase (NAD+)
MESSTEAMARIDHRKLRRFLIASFEKFGVPKSDAEIAANALVMADLRGVDTHGVIRFNPHTCYVKWLSEGSMKVKPDIKIIHETASSALLDGDCGIGMVIGHRAMELAIRKAKESGVAMVGVRNSRHVGELRDDGVAARYDRHRHDQCEQTGGSNLRPRSKVWHQSDVLRGALG